MGELIAIECSYASGSLSVTIPVGDGANRIDFPSMDVTLCHRLRIISRTTLRKYGKTFPKAVAPLSDWEGRVCAAKWKSLVDTRKMFPHADQVTLDDHVKGKRVITVFNVHGNDFRLLTSVHYNTGKVYILDLLTHAEYDKNEWKKRF